MQNVIDFLSDLKDNNNRDWFQENKPRFEEAKDTILTFVGKLIPELKKFDESIGEVLPKDCLFRIYRDIRFSKDKTPYKTNMGAVIANGGRKSKYAGYYLHIESDKSFLAGGAYCPQKEELQKIRNEIYYNPQDFRQIIDGKEFSKYFNGLWDDKLSRPPKGFDKDFEEIDLIKYKSFVVSHEVSNKQLVAPDFMKYAIGVYQSTYELNNFINSSFQS